jgi:hypothetical protein
VSDQDIRKYEPYGAKMKADSNAAGAGNFAFGEEKGSVGGAGSSGAGGREGSGDSKERAEALASGMSAADGAGDDDLYN